MIRIFELWVMFRVKTFLLFVSKLERTNRKKPKKEKTMNEQSEKSTHKTHLKNVSQEKYSRSVLREQKSWSTGNRPKTRVTSRDLQIGLKMQQNCFGGHHVVKKKKKEKKLCLKKGMIISTGDCDASHTLKYSQSQFDLWVCALQKYCQNTPNITW